MPKEMKPGKPTTRRYTEQEKEQAIRLVRQARAEGRDHGAVQRISEQLGYGVETVRKWVKRADVDEGLKPGRSSEDAAKIKALELATLSWVHWFNEDRLHGHCGDVPPAEFEAAFYAAQQASPTGVGIQ